MKVYNNIHDRKEEVDKFTRNKLIRNEYLYLYTYIIHQMECC